MRLLLTITILHFIVGSLQAQDFHKKSEVSSSVLKKYEKAQEFSQATKYADALDLFAVCQKKDPLFYDAFYRAGIIYAMLGDFEQAEEQFLNCMLLATDYRKDLRLNLGKVKLEQEKYEDAIQYFEAYLDSKPRNENQVLIVQKMITDAKFMSSVYKDIPFDPKPLEQFNTKRDEYFPTISIEGDEFVFTRRVFFEDKPNEDFFRASLNEQGEWSDPIAYTEMNTPLSEGARSLSADGKTAIVTYCNQRVGVGRCDLYKSELVNGKWTNYKNLDRPVNSPYWESQPSISANGEFLIFSSDRPGGYGGIDLWMSSLQSDNTWADPVNMGPNINTAMDDRSPFLHSDGRTLYFSSNGHPGFGGFDFFISRLDDAGNWSKPENFGSPLNTDKDQGMLIVNFQGDKAYLASNRSFVDPTESSKDSNYDLYEFDLYEGARPQKAVFVRGIVRDAVTLEPIIASIELADIRRSDSEIVKVTDKDGQFLYVLEDKREYGLFAQAEGYLMNSLNFNLLDDQLESSKGLEIFLTPVSKEPTEDQTILENVFFESGSAKLKDKSFLELDKLAALILDNNLSIRVIGHTDDVGTAEDNLILSESRAEAVVNYLVEQGVESSSLQFEGRGENEPIADNTTEAGRKRNRRTSFMVLD
jgi:outer membrane protein OmpA-like peptidoglycan-associated protein/Tfp pilus assembly protein PilF